MAAIRQLILEVAPTRASVMIYGESGTGKELVAQAIHRYSKQSNGPFVPVNMAAIPHGLAESLLFGHEKGAFTSAVHNQKGWCEAADGGTLFLDEVGDMEIQVQPKLLRFLQEGTLQRVGSQVSQRVTVRVITATNRDPGAVVAEAGCGKICFSGCTWCRFTCLRCAIGRRTFRRWRSSFCGWRRSVTIELSRDFSDDAMRVLQQHDWPGNVRQLENTVERLVIFARGRIVEADHIPADDHLVSAYAERRRVLAGRAAERVNGDEFDPIVSPDADRASRAGGDCRCAASRGRARGGCCPAARTRAGDRLSQDQAVRDSARATPSRQARQVSGPAGRKPNLQ